MPRQRMPIAAWVTIGAIVGPILGILYAWGRGGSEWTDAGVFFGVVGLCVGAFVGLVVGVFRDETDAS